MKYILLVLLAAVALLTTLFLTQSTFTVIYSLDRDGPLKDIDLAQMERLQRNQLTVYFFPEHRGLGAEVTEALEQSWRIVRERLGLDLGRFGVAIVVPKPDEELGGVSLRRKIWALWDPIVPILTSPGLQSLQQADRDTLIAVYWGMAHEAMELNVVKKLYHDPAARWVGDGLAEYVGYAITSELAPRVRNEILAIRRRHVQLGLLDQGYKQYDLTKEFLVIRDQKGKDSQGQRPAGVTADPGYGVSLAFWLQIAQRHGEGVIKSFWQRLSQRGFPNAHEAARILSELTGEDIWSKLQNMDLQEVLQTLEAAAGAP